METTTSEEYKVTVTNRKCKVCKAKFYWTSRDNQYNSFPDNSTCRDCQFWVENLMADWNGRTYFIINGEHYCTSNWAKDLEVKPEDSLGELAKRYDSGGKFKGMGGTKYIIRRNDNKIFITDDLWHQGEIPATLRKLQAFQDNAEFVA